MDSNLRSIVAWHYSGFHGIYEESPCTVCVTYTEEAKGMICLCDAWGWFGWRGSKIGSTNLSDWWRLGSTNSSIGIWHYVNAWSGSLFWSYMKCSYCGVACCIHQGFVWFKDFSREKWGKRKTRWKTMTFILFFFSLSFILWNPWTKTKLEVMSYKNE